MVRERRLAGAPFSAMMGLLARYFLAPRALNDYATHIPILIGLARIREIRSVLEFGCGNYSTLTFLNASAFPQLERLQSIENDESWAGTIQEVAKHDSRWTLRVVNGEIADAVCDIDLEAFDLILIDDSKSSAQRAATIRAIATKQPQHAWIVIHDFEVEEYRRAASGFKNRHRFRAYNPETGVVGNRVAEWKTIDRVIKSKAKVFEPDAIEKWTTV